jgi:cytochrome P450
MPEAGRSTRRSPRSPEAPGPPPLQPGLPVIGNLIAFLREPMALLLAGYRRHGPVFRIQLGRRRFTVLAGAQANQFASRSSDLFAAERFWRGFGRQLGVTESFLPSMDGPAHLRLRKVMQRSYARGAILGRFEEVVAITREVVTPLAGAGPQPLVTVMRRPVTQQLGLLLTNRAPGDHFDDLVTFVRTGLNVTVLERWPKLMLATPGYRRARRRVLQLGAEVLASHRQPRAGAPDLVDDLLAASAQGKPPLVERDLVIAALGPFIAGLDTVANTCAFLIYRLLNDPAALARVQAEADALFGAGVPTPAALKETPALHGAVMETLRLHAIAPFLGRTAARAFSFAGHAVASDEDLLVATTLPHHLAEHFPDPARFDLDRFRAPRNEHQTPGAYAPFGFGPHTCLGGGLAEIQIALTVATLLHDFSFQLEEPGPPAEGQDGPHPDAGPPAEGAPAAAANLGRGRLGGGGGGGLPGRRGGGRAGGLGGRRGRAGRRLHAGLRGRAQEGQRPGGVGVEVGGPALDADPTGVLALLQGGEEGGVVELLRRQREASAVGVGDVDVLDVVLRRHQDGRVPPSPATGGRSRPSAGSWGG